MENKELITEESIDQLITQELIDRVVQEASKRYGHCFGLGNRRVVYKISDKFVIKIPLNKEGVEHNRKERKMYLEDEKGHYARCYLFRYKNVPLLVMDFVTPIETGKRQDLPDWTLFIDLQQVGYNKRRQLVAYDYATPVSKPNWSI